jgi:hypothetical protein
MNVFAPQIDLTTPSRFTPSTKHTTPHHRANANPQTNQKIQKQPVVEASHVSAEMAQRDGFPSAAAEWVVDLRSRSKMARVSPQ